MKRRVYVDNAATTKLDSDAFRGMLPYLLGDFGNASQPYSFSSKTRQALKEARKEIAMCINAEPEEIFFTSGGTESNNWAIKSISNSVEEKGTVITSEVEHHAVLNSCMKIEKNGYKVKYLPVNKIGEICKTDLKSRITQDTRLITIMLANNEIGTINSIKELVDVAHEEGVLFHTDAVQAVGHVPVDVRTLNIDLLSASAHKFNGPKGIGFLFIKKGVNIDTYFDGGAQEFGKRAGTENVAAIVGMAIALKKNVLEMERNSKKINELESLLLNELEKGDISYIVNGGKTKLPGNISLSFKGIEGEQLLHRLDLQGISVSTGSACDSKTTQVSHVIKAINVNEEFAKGTIRISLGKDNSYEDIYYIVNAIKRILGKGTNHR